MTVTARSLDQLSVDTIRTLAIDGVQRANSGHPGAPMGMAPMAYVLWTRVMRHAPTEPTWPDRDRFVLSAGHASMLLYAMLHLTGYDLTIDDLQHFRQWGSRTPGHPEWGLTPGVEATTGRSGRASPTRSAWPSPSAGWRPSSNATAARSSITGRTSSAPTATCRKASRAEAASLAGHLRLGKLIVLYDDNGIQLDGPTAMAFSEDVPARFDAYGWHTQRVSDGNDLDAIGDAITAAQADDRPSLIAVRTHIGFGSPNKQDSQKAHGAPLGVDEVRLTKEAYGWDPDALVLRARRRPAALRGRGRAWPAARRRLARSACGAGRRGSGGRGRIRATHRRTPTGWLGGRPAGLWSGRRDGHATGLAADAAGRGSRAAGAVRRLRRPVGEQPDRRQGRQPTSRPPTPDGTCASASASTPWAASPTASPTTAGSIRMSGTFLNFSDYMRGAVRLASLAGLPVTYVWTHDSVGLGEDGPTHEPIEHYAALRAMPNLWFVRPGDPNETVAAWRLAVERPDGPVALALTRQKVPVLPGTAELATEGLRRGGYVLADAEDAGGVIAQPDLILIATGSELSLAVAARATLEAEGIRTRVVSMPCWERFAAQPASYRDEVLPPSLRQAGEHRGRGLAGLGPLGRTGGRDDRHRALRRLGARGHHLRGLRLHRGCRRPRRSRRPDRDDPRRRLATAR